MMAAALLFVPCTALRRIHEYVIHTYLTFFSVKLLVFFLTHLPELPCLGRYMTLTDMQLSSHQQNKQQAANSIIGPSVTYM